MRPASRRRSVAPAVEVASGEPAARWWRLAVPVLAALVLAMGLRSVLVQKLAEHVVLQPLAPLLPAGGLPGGLAAPRAIKADGRGGIVSLSRLDHGWRVQRFGADLALQAHADLPASLLGELSDLAAMPDGTVWLCGENGSLWRLDAALRLGLRARALRTGLDGLRYIERVDGGGLAGLDCAGGVFVRLDALGRVLRQHPMPEAGRATGLVALPEGVAWLEFEGGKAWVRVFDAEGGALRRFPVDGVVPEPGDRLAASGGILLINDQGGPLGVVFYTSQGRPLGHSLGGTPYCVANPGFVAGDLAGGLAYVHFNQGLLKFRLPWPEAL